jgi:ABC-2 type transport system permease protein
VFVVAANKTGSFSGHWPVTDHLQALITPFPSSVELTGDLKEKKGDVTASAVATTTARSWRQTGFFIFNPKEAARTTDVGPFTLGYALEGKIKSAFAAPPGVTADPASSSAELAKHLHEAPANTRLLVMGDSDFMNDQNLPLRQVQAYQYNLLFAVNTVDWMMHDESLITLRAKGMSARPLSLQYDAKVAFWRLCDIDGIPLLLILVGLVMWRVRLSRRRSVQL